MNPSSALRYLICFLCFSSVAFAQDSVPEPQSDSIGDEPTLPAPPAEVTLGKQDYKESWQQAGVTTELGNRLRNHVLRLGPDNQLQGRIGVIEQATGKLTPMTGGQVVFIQNGVVRATVIPDATGLLRTTELGPGVYSMIGCGRTEFVASSVNILPVNPNVVKFTKVTQEDVSLLSFNTAAVPASDYGAVRSLLKTYLPATAGATLVDGTEAPEAMQTGDPANSTEGTEIRHHIVRLTEDGRLHGRVRHLQNGSGLDLKIKRLNMFLVKDNKFAHQVPVNPKGLFAFTGVRPGVYSLVAAGTDGFLAMGIDVLSPKRLDSTVPKQPLEAEPRTEVSAKLQIEQLQLDVPLCAPCNFNQVNVQQHAGCVTYVPSAPLVASAAPIEAAPAMIGYGGGGFPVGGGGFGGGFGGGAGAAGSGLGGILLATGLGVGATALLDDDDDSRRTVSSPASP